MSSPTSQPSPDGAAPHDLDTRVAFELHLIEHLGPEFVRLEEHVSVGIHLDLLVFPPHGDRDVIVIVTSGMSDVPQLLPHGMEQRVELALCVPPGWPGIDPLDRESLTDEANYWPLRLLKTLARLPRQHDTFLTWGHTVDLEGDGPFFPDSVPFSSALIGPPVPLPAGIMTARVPQGTVNLFGVFATTRLELAFATSMPRASDALLDGLLDADVTTLVTRDRTSVTAPPQWMAHVFYDQRFPHLGEVLAPVVPNRAAWLGEQEASTAVVPMGEEESPVRCLLSSAFPLDLLEDQWGGDVSPEVRQALQAHQSVMTVAPARPGVEMALPTNVLIHLAAQHESATVVWMPDHGSLETASAAAERLGTGVIANPVPLPLPDGSVAARTKGFAVVGGREVILREQGCTFAQNADRLRPLLEQMPGLPTAGERFTFGFSAYQLVEGPDPVTGEPALLAQRAPKEGGGLLGRIFGRGAKDER